MFLALAVWAILAGAGAAAELVLRMPGGLIAQGFDKQILPRFRFKSRISVTAVAGGAADMALSDGADGVVVFSDGDGREYRLASLTGAAETKAGAEAFLDWLRSKPGRAAVEGFAPEGSQVFFTAARAKAAPAPEVFDGDAAKGARLALANCGRCHVVDARNRMGGIGSTPSFGALRARANWSDLFRAFYVKNPHPSFTQIEGVTEPFDPDHLPHIAPVTITEADLEAIVAFVATLKPKDLGQPVRRN